MKYIPFAIPILIIAAIIYLTMSNDNNDKEKTSVASTVAIISTDNSEVKGALTSSEKIIKSVSVKEAKELIAAGNEASFKIIDIRTPQEYEDGHIDGAQLLNFYDNNFAESVKNLDRDSMYLIYCRSGNRSTSALKIFADNDFKEVYELSGGYIAWSNDK